uniref:Uncharacterized protein n=1 Tax=Candidatus Kentrum sp. UNK TaxID=2126344 RepID=A0A451B1H6_9GAMM|nr:MAG: hypothetical protein BECKUNK1418H_GA0071006_109713 [Candidatus Kentron sp. UNK]
MAGVERPQARAPQISELGLISLDPRHPVFSRRPQTIDVWSYLMPKFLNKVLLIATI